MWNCVAHATQRHIMPTTAGASRPRLASSRPRLLDNIGAQPLAACVKAARPKLISSQSYKAAARFTRAARLLSAGRREALVM